MLRGSIAVFIAFAMLAPLGLRTIPTAAAGGGKLWLDCDPGAKAQGGGWKAGGVVCLPGPYSENAVLNFKLIVINKGNDQTDLRVFLAIHGPGVIGNSNAEYETTPDDMVSITVEGQTLHLSDFGNTAYNPFDDGFGGIHGVYQGDDAIWAEYLHAPNVLPGHTTVELDVTVVLGPNPSPLFEVHFDAWDAKSDDKTPNGHDVTLVAAETGGNQPPEACFVFLPSNIVNESDLVTMDASCSTDPDGTNDIISYEWDFDINVDSSGDGITDNDVDATGIVVSFTWYDDYVSTVKLTVTDTAGNVDEAFGDVTIDNVAPTGTFEGGVIEFQLCIRLAGSKWSNVELKVWDNFDPATGEGDTLLGDIEVERWPGPPDANPTSTGSNCIPMLLDLTQTVHYTAVVTYDPFPDNGDAIRGDQPNNGKDPNNNAGNPVWLICKFPDGTVCKWHHTFNTQQSMIRDSNHWNHVEPWIVPLNFSAAAGIPLKFMASAIDPGTDDLEFAWDWGDGTTTVTDYLYDAIRGTDPAGSPYEPYAPPLGLNDPAPPISVTDTVFHTYSSAGTYTVTLTVTDDDGGQWTYSTTITVVDSFC